MNTVALRSSSGWAYPVLVGRCSRGGARRSRSRPGQDVSTTMIYTYVPNRGPAGSQSSAGRMFL